LIKGKVQKRKYNEAELEFKIKTITLLSSVKDELIKSVTIRVKIEDLSLELISELIQFVKENPGETELKFLIIDLNEKLSIPMFSRIVKVRLNNNLISYLEDHPSLDFKVN
jgi:DNA polymerase III subunit alpha